MKLLLLQSLQLIANQWKRTYMVTNFIEDEKMKPTGWENLSVGRKTITKISSRSHNYLCLVIGIGIVIAITILFGEEHWAVFDHNDDGCCLVDNVDDEEESCIEPVDSSLSSLS